MKAIYPHSIRSASITEVTQSRQSAKQSEAFAARQTDGATVIEISPELPSPQAAGAAVEPITEQLSEQPSRALQAVSNLDPSRINRLLLED